MIYDVEYAPIPGREGAYFVRALEHPALRMDIAGEDQISNVAASLLAVWLRVPLDDVTVRARRVDMIPGRDAPLGIEAPSVAESIRRLDEQLET